MPSSSSDVVTSRTSHSHDDRKLLVIWPLDSKEMTISVKKIGENVDDCTANYMENARDYKLRPTQKLTGFMTHSMAKQNPAVESMFKSCAILLERHVL